MKRCCRVGLCIFLDLFIYSYGIYNVGGDAGFVGMDKNTIWYKDYMYYYGGRKFALNPSCWGLSHLVFWSESGAAVINLCFAGSEDE